MAFTGDMSHFGTNKQADIMSLLLNNGKREKLQKFWV